MTLPLSPAVYAVRPSLAIASPETRPVGFSSVSVRVPRLTSHTMSRQSGRASPIGARRRRHGRPQLAARAPSSSARRPDGLAYYMGYGPHRREGHVRCGRLPSPSVIRTPDRGLLLVVPSGRLPEVV
jgi:hypothetical protein